MIIEEVRVARRERLSPSFVRVELTGQGLAELGVDGPTYDQRIKLVFPGAAGTLPRLEAGPPGEYSWYSDWQALPEAERGHMRTYTVRDLYGSGEARRLVVDVVVHPAHDPGDVGPGAAWAEQVQPGDAVVVVGPKIGVDWGGIAFAPGTADDLLLVGDETAVPAVAAILGQLPADARGTAYLEVPWVEDIQQLRAPRGVEVVWLSRCGEAPGSHVVPALRRHLGLGGDAVVERAENEIWDEPEVPVAAGRYAWIAGESGVVRTLRRTLVSEAGWDKGEVAFMGYWRIGVAMA
nr:siderophore-interacting protein [Nocardioides mangrovicus]